MQVGKESLKGYIESIILITLLSQDLYGYDISKKIQLMSDGKFEIKEGTIYAVLTRLKASGLITTYWGEEESNGGRRKYNKLTEEGLEYLKSKKMEWEFFKNILEVFFKEVK